MSTGTFDKLDFPVIKTAKNILTKSYLDRRIKISLFKYYKLQFQHIYIKTIICITNTSISLRQVYLSKSNMLCKVHKLHKCTNIFTDSKITV